MVAVARPAKPVVEEAGEKEGVLSPDEARLQALIASRLGRLQALETERKEFERVRAHLGDLMSHNRDELQRTVEEIDGLERLLRSAELIRMTITLG